MGNFQDRGTQLKACMYICIPTYKQAQEKFSETYEDELGCRDKANGILLPFI